MVITKFETWWVERGHSLFDEKRQGGAKMGWDVLVVKLTTDTGIEGVATCMAARSGALSEAYLQESIGPVVLGRDPHDREAIFQQLWVVDRHEAFFPVFLPGPVDVALWDICAKEAGLPLYKYIGAYRDSLPVYASSNFYPDVKTYVDEALYYKSRGIKAYKPQHHCIDTIEVVRRLADGQRLVPYHLPATHQVGVVDHTVKAFFEFRNLNFEF